jgi:translation initiation factor eIF-2B subunit delta
MTLQPTSAASPLDPTAPTFEMPISPKIPKSKDAVIKSFANGPTKEQGQEGASKRSANKRSEGNNGVVQQPVEGASVATTGTGDAGDQKPSNKELKLRQKAEKQAKRAAQKSTPGIVPVIEQDQQHGQKPHMQQSPIEQKGSSIPGKGQSVQGVKITDMTTHHNRRASPSRGLPNRLPAVGTTQRKETTVEKHPAQTKKVAMLSHLYSKDRRTSIAGVGREIHPAVLTLGIQLRDYVICGSNARCVATLLVFKKVIQSYITPPAVALPRHLTTHLSHQISYLSSSRPLSTSQGNSIRWLKKLVVELDPKISDPDAREYLCGSIDLFIREKVTLADEVIAREASKKIANGDVVLVYAKSSVVEKTLVAAHRQGKDFCVVVTDSRPLFEGKNLARGLVRAGLQHVQYCLLTGLGSLSKKVTKCFLGASAMMGNGRLYSRVGTAMVAMMAKDCGANVPVIVLCESVKFSNRIVLDSIVANEVADADALVDHAHGGDNNPITTSSPAPTNQPTATKKGKSGLTASESDNTATATAADNDPSRRRRPGLITSTAFSSSSLPPPLLQGWAEQPNLQLLNLMYDVTPAEYLDVVITELGDIPPGAVSAVNGVWGGEA